MSCLIHDALILKHLLSIVLIFSGQRSGDDLSKKPSSSEPPQSDTGDHTSQPAPMRTVSSRMKNLMRDELLINVRKFETQVRIYTVYFIQYNMHAQQLKSSVFLFHVLFWAVQISHSLHTIDIQ